MSIEVLLPQYGMGMMEGTVTQWMKAVGDQVGEGEVIAEIEAAKATVDLVAPVAGTLSKILVQAGETIPVYTPVALID